MPRMMDKCEGVEKSIIFEGKFRGRNGTLRTAGRGGNRAPPAMRFLAEGGNGETPRIADGGGNRAPIIMDECEGGDEGGNIATPPRRSPVINPYAKYSRPVGVRNGSSDRGRGGSINVEKSSRKCGKFKGSGTKLNRKKNIPRNIGHDYFMHAFGRSGIVSDIVREEGK